MNTIKDPHCMNCKVPWNNDFLLSSFPKSFVNTDIRAHREKVLLEREKALLPETQLNIQRTKAMREIDLITSLLKFYDRKGNLMETDFYYDKVVAIREGLGMPIPTRPTNSQRPRSNEPPKPPRPVRSCINDNCRGFILNNTWHCGLCNKKVCKKCMIELIHDTDHVCKDEDVETTKLLLNNTKPCPGCRIMISKVDGCSQMWCVNCHVTFDWDTLEKVTTHVHNPHYHEWMRRNGRNIPREPGDIPPMPPILVCGQLPSQDQLVQALHGLVDEPTQHTIQAVLTIGYHIEDEQRKKRERAREQERLVIYKMRGNFHVKLREMYLRNEITDDEWKRKLFQEEKKRTREQENHGVFELLLIQIRETFAAILTRPPAGEVLRMHTDLIALTDYCNDAFDGIASTYGNSPYYISLDDVTVRKVSGVAASAAAPARRPPSNYRIFIKARIAELLREHPEARPRELMRMAVDAWNALKEDKTSAK